MGILSVQHPHNQTSEVVNSSDLPAREQVRRRQIVSTILLVIVLFQLVDLPGAVLTHSPSSIGIVILGLALCGLAMLFNQLGKLTVVSILLIVVVDLGCGLMLLTMPMGLDVGDLPVFDVLLISELIAVSLLPAICVFPVAFVNIVFIITAITLLPHTAALGMMLTSDMAYNTISGPISLQIVVAIISYIWVRSALRAIARADRAEEIAELQTRESQLLAREAERTRQLDTGSEHLLHVLVRAANGDRAIRAALSQDNLLWRISNTLNVLLTRLHRASQAEEENRQLRMEKAHLTQTLLQARVREQQFSHHNPRMR